MSKSKIITYSLDMRPVLLDRVTQICKADGLSIQSFMENAIYEATLRSERLSTPAREALRDATVYPEQCDVCGRRFKLPMHLANHARSHIEPVEEEVSRPDPEQPPAPKPEPKPKFNKAEPLEPVEFVPEFKLGVDPSLIEIDESITTIKYQETNPTITTPEPSFEDDIPTL